ncbi:MAG: hypothetical protein GY939_14395, partial [Actinomycetia bacterium]|nr:hypothetical protein [Actinomycetes bacterium]
QVWLQVETPSDPGWANATFLLEYTVDPEPGRYRVRRVAADDRLNLRRRPGVDSPVVATLGPTATGVEGTGRSAWPGSSQWVEIVSAVDSEHNGEGDGAVGWANKHFLEPLS